MRDKNISDWSDDESPTLHREAVVAEGLKARAGSHDSERFKSAWLRFLESSGGTALITVVLGGIIGQLLAWSIQSGLKDREFQETWLKARGDQALVSYREYANQEQELMKTTYDLIGSCISASEDLIVLTSPEFAPDKFFGAVEQRTALRQKYNKVDAQWRSEKEKIGLLMGYYHPNQPDVTSAWHETQGSVCEYMDCAAKWYLDHGQPIDTTHACQTEKQAVGENLTKFNVSLGQARTYPWDGWESPEKLKAALNKN